MSLEKELNLSVPIKLDSHEALLNIYYTASCLKKKADEFFKPFGLTDVQFNLMVLLKHQAEDNGGLSQARLSQMMLVNRANITSLVDRMEKAQFVERTASANDRRYNIVKLTAKGQKLLKEVEELYAREVKKIMSVLQELEQKKLISMLEKVRAGLQ
ncbi:MAG: MarR family transcriptional regulator [Phycisphaerae bacterium]